MSVSAIEWTDATWNPVTGCSRVSPGCAHCYALELAPRLRAMGLAKYEHARDGGRASGPAFGVTLHPGVLKEPLGWRRPRRVFVNSMSDLFHEEVSVEFIAQVYAVMAATPRHTFQVLTKRPERMRVVLRAAPFWDRVRHHLRRNDSALEWVEYERPDNVWLGVSIENRRFVGRADVLRDTPAAVRFISAEPLLGPLLPDADHLIDADGDLYPVGNADVRAWRPWADGYAGPALSLERIDWLIVGGESGQGHRPVREEWVRDLKEHCQEECWQGDREGVTAFFFKQWGGRTPKAGGRDLDGRTWDEFPEREAVPAHA